MNEKLKVIVRYGFPYEVRSSLRWFKIFKIFKDLNIWVVRFISRYNLYLFNDLIDLQRKEAPK